MHNFIYFRLNQTKLLPAKLWSSATGNAVLTPLAVWFHHGVASRPYFTIRSYVLTHPRGHWHCLKLIHRMTKYGNNTSRFLIVDPLTLVIPGSHSTISQAFSDLTTCTMLTKRIPEVFLLLPNLAKFQYRSNWRNDLAGMLIRLAWVSLRTPPMPHRLIRLAEPHA